jgi:hypothetical protein
MLHLIRVNVGGYYYSDICSDINPGVINLGHINMGAYLGAYLSGRLIKW